MERRFSVPLPFDEFRVWASRARPHLEADGFPMGALKVVEYVFTEMLNNALDHSSSDRTDIGLATDPTEMRCEIADFGVGLFRHIQECLGLPAREDALVELIKGKTTTDSQRHTGEGVFFSIRVCDRFSVNANGLALSFQERGARQSLLKFPDLAAQAGTRVYFSIRRDTDVVLERVFDEFCPQPEMRFTRTVLRVRVQEEADGALVSRSQGKRLVNGLERFAAVVFDFSGVAAIQRGFADEVFRVWRTAHPTVRVSVTGAAESVVAMLRHVGYPGG